MNIKYGQQKKSYSSQIQLLSLLSQPKRDFDSKYLMEFFQKVFECSFKTYFPPLLSFDVPSFSTYIAFSQRKDLNFGRRMQWSKWPIPGKVQLERAYDDFMTFFEKQVFSCLIFSNRKDIKNPSIFNIIRWLAVPLGRTTHRPSVWCSKHYFFS